LGDLNVSKVARRGLGYTQTGTPYYASPEVWKDQPYDSKSDIWSLGCVLYEMTTLKPPFQAENMEGLYNKVIKGQIKKIPERFSTDLGEIIRLLIQVSPESRPSCDQILKHPMIQKRIEYFKNYSDENEDQSLLQTIRIPKNLLFLSDKLPQPNYEKQSSVKKNHSFTKKIPMELPDIGLRNNPVKKKKIKRDNCEPESSSNIQLTSSNNDNDMIQISPTIANIKKKSNKENNGNAINSPTEKLNIIFEEEKDLNIDKSQLKKSTDKEKRRSRSERRIENLNSDDINNYQNVQINRRNFSPNIENSYDLPQVKNSSGRKKEM
jgi:NIMA (never in mitosis gene a)-related kinase